MSSIPKRAALHGTFVSSAEAMTVALKPGQAQLRREGHYTTEARPPEETYLAHNESMVPGPDRLLPEDYATPRRPFKPKIDEVVDSSTGAAHWRSEYGGGFHGSPKARAFQKFVPTFEGDARKEVSACNVPSGAGTYAQDYAPPDALDRLRCELTKGTTRGTQHVPGYQGFLPGCTRHPKVAAFEAGAGERCVDKSILIDTFAQQVPGYAGHIPKSAKNSLVSNAGRRHLMEMEALQSP